jgi:hypothetical protein
MGVSRAGEQPQHLIDEQRARGFRPTLRDGGVALCMGQGEYLLLRVTESGVTGIREASFAAKVRGELVRRKPPGEPEF